MFVGYFLVSFTVGIYQAVDSLAVNNGLTKDFRNVLYPDPLVEDVLWFDDHQGAPLAETVATGSPDIYSGGQIHLADLFFEGSRNRLAAVGMATCSIAYRDNSFIGVSFRGYRFT